MTDRLTLTRALEGAGIKSEAADRIASEIYDAIHDNVATKTDLRELEGRLDVRFAEVATTINETKAEIFKAMLTQTLVIVGAMAGMLGLMFTALHLWPPHP
jgi:2-phosphoglycerate kinase